MTDLTIQIEFSYGHGKRKRRIAQLILRQAAMKYAIIESFMVNQNKHIHTDTCEPIPRYIRAALSEFNHRYLGGKLDEFEFHVTMRDDMSGTVVTWDGQGELSKLLNMRVGLDR